MCNECCKQLGGWCRAFTASERVLTILEAVLLVIFFVFLVFLILHLIVCANYPLFMPDNVTNAPPQSTTATNLQDSTITTLKDSTTRTLSVSKTYTTMDPERECSWTPSAKTTAETHYYENGATKVPKMGTKRTTKDIITKQPPSPAPRPPVVEDFALSERSATVSADAAQRAFTLALVKPRPPRDALFGCALTLVASRWALTAASCLEAVEEMDSLDSFVIVEDWGGSAAGDAAAVDDVRVHPLYRGSNRSYDVAALRSERAYDEARAAQLASALDLSLLALGSRMHVLGFGPYRRPPSASAVAGAGARRLRAARVWRAAGAQCGEGAAEGGVLRHLWAGRAVGSAPCAWAWPLCAGALYGRDGACAYCSGAALTRRGRVLALMAHNAACGATCEPQLYVNLAALRDWIDSVLSSH